MREFFDLADNPLFIKHFRSRLRRASVVPALLLVFVGSAFIVAIDSNARDTDPASTVGSQLFFAMQMFLLVVMGGSQIASAISQVRDSGVLDYHRLTPIPSSVQTIGFLIGAPIREYILYLVTIPFALYCSLVGEVGIVGFAKLFLVQVGVVLMSHSVALITGLAARSARGASGTFVVVAMILNGASIGLYNAGIYGPSMLSSFPVYHEVFYGKLRWQQQQQQQAWQQQQQQQAWQQQQQQPFPPAGPRPPRKQGAFVPPVLPPQPMGNPVPPAQADPITFYGGAVPVALQSLLFQGTFLTFLFIAASRRIRSARVPMLSKKEALLFLSCVGCLTLGSLWSSTQVMAVMGIVYFLTFLALVLSGLLTPDRGDVGKGMQRAHRLFGGNIPLWHDLTSTKLIVPLLALLAALPAVIAALVTQAPPLLPGRGANEPFLPWGPIATGFFTILSFGFARQALPLSAGKRWSAMFALYIVLVWGMPVAFGGIANAMGLHEAVYGMVLSPLLGIVGSSRLAFADADQTALMMLSMVPPVVLTLLFFSILTTGQNRLAASVVEEQEQRYPKVEEAA